jgi:hypothetical protein
MERSPSVDHVRHGRTLPEHGQTFGEDTGMQLRHGSLLDHWRDIADLAAIAQAHPRQSQAAVEDMIGQFYYEACGTHLVAAAQLVAALCATLKIDPTQLEKLAELMQAQGFGGE